MKNRKYTKQILKTLLLLLIPLFMLGVTASSTAKKTLAEEEEVVVTPKFTPTKDRSKFLGIWMSSGYDLQPNSDYYTTVGNSVTIRTNTRRSVWDAITGVFDSIHFRWWKSTDGKKWSEVNKNDNGQRKNFTVTPTTPGTTYYQLDTQYYKYVTWYLKTNLYSQVTAVHALPEPVDALELKVTVDDDYLYNTSDKLSNTTYAHATPTPSNATGNITWSVDNPDLATIDEDGQITANSKSLSGWVEVTATMTNPNNPPVSDSVKVEIGGGLDDQTVKSGTIATYPLKGRTGGDDDGSSNGKVTVDWYKYAPGSNSRVKVASGDATTYQTPTTTINDDGSYFQAVITFKTGSISKTITTNKALLTVIPAGDPDLELTNQLVNNSYTDENDTPLKLNKVINGDQVTYTDTVKNKSSDGILKDGYYVLPLHTGTIINSVTVAGQTIDSSQYTVIHNDETNTNDLVIPLNTINVSDSVAVEVNTTVQTILGPEKLQFTPYVYGTSNDGDVYRQEGTQEEINYISGHLSASVPTSIDYGTIKAYSTDTLKFRQDELNSPNNVVEVDDQRRDKTSVRVSVEQTGEFIDNNSDNLSANLRYYQNSNYSEILNNKTTVSQTNHGDSLASIAWNKEDGLLLYIYDTALKAGSYSTMLTWHFEDVP